MFETSREKFAQLLCVAYVVLGVIWLFVTEHLAAPAAHDPRHFQQAHILGWLAFIIVSAFLAYGLLRKARASQLRLQDRLATIAAALIEGGGRIGEVLRCVLACERGDWDAAARLGLEERVLSSTNLEAIAWAEANSRALGE